MQDNYEAPAINELGSLEDMTQGNLDGGGLDATFPTMTPKSQLRFS